VLQITCHECPSDAYADYFMSSVEDGDRDPPSVAASRNKVEPERAGEEQHSLTEEQLARLAAIVESSEDAIISKTLEGIITTWNEGAQRIYGYSAEEAVGQPISMLVPPERPDEVPEILEKIRRGEKVEHFETVRLTKDGRRLDVSLVVSPIKDAEGNVVGGSTIARDVTERKDTEERLRRAEQVYRALIERMPAITYIQRMGLTSETVYVSPQVTDIVGYTPEEYTSTPDLWIKILHPDDREAVLAEDRRTNETGEPFVMEYRQLAKDGHEVWIRDEATLVKNEEGQPLYWLGVRLDITERKRAEEALADAEQRYRTLVEQIPAVTYIDPVDDPDTSLYTSPHIERMLGYTPEEWQTEKLWPRRLHPDDRERILAADERFEAGGEESFSEEYRLLAKDGSVVWVREEAVVIKDEEGRPLYWQGVFYDLTERKALEERLEHRAFHDPLTDLPNRYLFLERLGRALDRTRRRRDRKAAVLYMDLDEFKVINDSLGHEVGDLLLTIVGHRLRRCLRPEDTLARFGGDEFVVLIEALDDPGQAVQVAGRITEELRKPFIVEQRELYVAASIGISVGDIRTHDPDALLREADTAMYRAKDEGGGFGMFDPAMYEQAFRRLEVENDLRRAIEQEEFVVHYQPIVPLNDDGEVTRIEALVRWDHPERGLLNPDDFVPIAEDSGLVVPMGELVLERACRQAVEWQQQFPHTAPLRMCVNLSARQLSRPDLAETVEGVLGKTGLEGSRLTLDITETVYVKMLAANTMILDHLRKLGVRLSIDDFGTGYASLSYLRRLPADSLKIDKSFIKRFGYDHEDTAVVRMIIELAHTLSLEVIAEGVETEEQLTLLKEMGCDFAQGFYFSQPLPSEAVSGVLAG
jgi:diguanylate cyclase (GGDEF)-like protein/PAS domain S-box-containing protein